MTDARTENRPDGDEHRPATPRPSVDPRTTLVVVSGFATVMLAALTALIPVPFATYSPGPVVNVLGSESGHPLIDITGRKTYDTSGQLDLTTVYVAGGPSRDVSLLTVVRTWLDPTRAVLPEDLVFPPGVTQAQYDQQDEEMMTSSQESATAAALDELDIPVPTTLRVTDVYEDAPASGLLKAGDVIVAVDGTTITGLDTLRDVVTGLSAGQVAAVTVMRSGARTTVSVPTYKAEDGRIVLGVLIAPVFDFPFSVKIRIDQVGGPSAGEMFALGIIDKLTPGLLNGGQRIAGTGAIDADGTIEPIGGIAQKMVGARNAGAQWFLAPDTNCADVIGHVPDGLRVVRTSTLHESVTALGTIAGSDSAAKAALPGC